MRWKHSERVQLNFESKTTQLLLQSPEPPVIFSEPPDFDSYKGLSFDSTFNSNLTQCL
jgi:hypothetical protein